MTFGNKLLQLRKDRKMSQDALAEKLGVTRQAVSKWELDEVLPDTNNIMKIADLFYVSVEYLTNEDVSKIEYRNKIRPLDIDKFDAVNFLAAFSSAFVSAIALVYYATIGYLQFEGSKNNWHYMSIYWEERYYEVVNEIVIVFFLIIVITISVIIAKRIYKKYR